MKNNAKPENQQAPISNEQENKFQFTKIAL